MILKEHVNHGKRVLAICDESIFKKTFQENDLILDLNSSFYNGQKINEEFLKSKLSAVYVIHAVGNNCITFLLKQRLIKDRDIKKIQKVPYAHIIFSS